MSRGGPTCSPPEVERAARVLANGGLVAFPTETVYGLGANLVEAIHENRLEDWGFWLTYAGISLGIGAYTAACCWYRMRGLWAWKKQHAKNHAAGDVVHRA